MRILRPAASTLLLMLAACAGASPRPTSPRELPVTDVNNCYSKAKQYGAGMLQGTLGLYLYIVEDGAVPAAWVHDTQGLNYPSFRNCLTLMGTTSKFESEKEDYLRGYTITCPPDSIRCTKDAITALPKQPLDEKLAQDSLTFAGWATSTDKGWGYYYTRQFPLAIAAFNEALKVNAGDVRALRGFAQATAESNGDLKAAREAAEKAVAAQRNAATLESLVRVCLKQNDDECAVKSFIDATKAPDKATRSFDLASLNEAVRAANDRLARTEETKSSEAKAAAEAAAAKADPEGCYKREGAERAICYVKHCFGAGAVAYGAGELKKVTGQTYLTGDWSATGDDAKGYMVTVPLRPPSEKLLASKSTKGKGKNARLSSDSSQDATWKITLGDNVNMQATTPSASFIAKDHNACKPRGKK
jgi:tetratricopeptide (TPR) repeat protein